MTVDMGHLFFLNGVFQDDIAVILQKEEGYKGSWKRRGGTGVFHVALARKWDRIEAFLEDHDYDVFEAALNDERTEGLRGDIADLRRYLALVEAELQNIEEQSRSRTQ